MDRRAVPDAAPRHKGGKRKKAPSGLRVVERDGIWHIHGTARVKGRSVRVRRSTELPAEDATWDAADEIRCQWEGEIRNEVIHGIKPSRPLGIAAREYLGLDGQGQPIEGGRADTLGATHTNVIQEITLEFGLRSFSELPDAEWNAFLDRRHAGNAADTRVRYVGAINPFLKWCAEKRYLQALPVLIARPAGAVSNRAARRKNPRRRVAELHPELIAFIFDHAAIHLKAQLYTEWSTGGRVSSVLFGCALADLTLTKTRQQLRYRFTKNGEDVTADQYRTEARLIQRFTQHWLRHWFATYGRAMGMSRKEVMNQAGWADERSLERYEHDIPEVRRRGVLALPLQASKKVAAP